jgi:hypothetical protein
MKRRDSTAGELVETAVAERKYTKVVRYAKVMQECSDWGMRNANYWLVGGGEDDGQTMDRRQGQRIGQMFSSTDTGDAEQRPL